jgi:flagellar biosynthetic protein FliR
MQSELTIAMSGLWGFLAVLSRVTACFAFVPIPGLRGQGDPAKVVLSLAATMAMMPLWPKLGTEPPAIGTILLWVGADAALGIGVGLTVAFLLEGFTLAAQVLGLQAGYSYASTIDPNSQTDSGVLQIAVQLAASLMFFALGLHRVVLKALAASLETFPPGTYVATLASAKALIGLGAGMFSLAARLAMPVVALLLLVDVTLALLGKINTHLQLLTLSFPVKMLLGLVLLGLVLGLSPALFEQSGRQILAAMAQVLGRR